MLTSANGFDLDDNIRGRYLAVSGVVQVLRPWAPVASYAKTNKTTLQLPNLSDEVQQTILTREHELFHFRQYMSTPLGMLLWRLINSLASDGLYIAYGLQSLKYEGDAAFPIDEWFSQDGARLLRQAVKSPIDFASSGQVATMLMAADSCAALRRFYALLWGRPAAASVGDLVDSSNIALGWIDAHTDLKATLKISTRLNRSSPLLAPGEFSVNEIVEGAARIFEFNMHLLHGSSESLISDWRKVAIHGVYAPVFNYLMEELPSPLFALAAADLALLAPFETVCYSGPTEVPLERLYPSKRLGPIVKAMKALIAGSTDDIIGAPFYEEVLESAGLPGMKSTLLPCVERSLVGPRAWGFAYQGSALANQMKVAGRTDIFDPQTLYARMHDLIKDGIRIRLANPLTLLLGGGGDGEGRFVPLLQLFDDTAYFTSRSNAADELLWLPKVFLNVFSDAIALAVCGAPSLGWLERAQMSIKSRIEGEETDSVFGFNPAFAALRRVTPEARQRVLELISLPELLEAKLGVRLARSLLARKR